MRLDYRVPTRGLMGYRSEFLAATSGTGLLHRVFDHYGARRQAPLGRRPQGVLISNATGKAVPFALFNLQERGRLLVGPQDEVYEGMIVGIHSRANDLTVNPLKTKQLTNIRAAGSDENVQLTPAERMSLERALEFLEDDELLEVTPHHLRLRKRHLVEGERRRHQRQSA